MLRIRSVHQSMASEFMMARGQRSLFMLFSKLSLLLFLLAVQCQVAVEQGSKAARRRRRRHHHHHRRLKKLFCVAFCVCANCRDSGIDYTSNNNNMLSMSSSKEETIIRKYG